MIAYLLSGLGCDKRAYQRLVFPDGITPVHIDWPSPVKDEPLDQYTNRLIKMMDTTNPFYLIGLSFGGMMACMIAEKTHPVKTIIISSVACREELPVFMKFLGKSRLYKLIPNRRLKKANPVICYFFGAHDPESKILLEEIIQDTDPLFLKWAIGSILQWKNCVCHENPIRIHGLRDRILPPRKFKPDYSVMDSGHFAVFDSANMVSSFIAQEIQSC
jgi:hypothetical protein